MKNFIKFILVIIVTLLFLPVSSPNISASTQHVPVIIGFKATPDARLIKSNNGEIKYIYHYIPAIACSLPTQAIATLQKNPKVAYIEQDFKVYAIGHGHGNGHGKTTPSQPNQTIPWGVEKIGAPKVWNMNYTGANVSIAILDTGIDTNHPDLHVAGGVTFVRGTKTYNDDNGHGTHVAGIVAALNNTIGVVGVAPNASLYVVKVLNRHGWGYTSDVIAGIEWSIDNHMQIISMSFGSTSDSDPLHNECDVAYNASIVLVAAAGNNGPDNNTITYPAKYSSVIAVGATNESDVVAEWSSRGPELELTAPGVDIYSTYKGSTYETLSGTSMACPHVTGTIALILSKNSTLTPDQIRDILRSSAVSLGLNSSYGYGRVNATAAVYDTP